MRAGGPLHWGQRAGRVFFSRRRQNRQGEGESCGTEVGGRARLDVGLIVDLIKGGGGQARPRIEDRRLAHGGGSRPAAGWRPRAGSGQAGLGRLDERPYGMDRLDAIPALTQEVSSCWPTLDLSQYSLGHEGAARGLLPRRKPTRALHRRLRKLAGPLKAVSVANWAGMANGWPCSALIRWVLSDEGGSGVDWAVKDCALW